MSESTNLHPRQKRALIQLAFHPDAMVTKLGDLKPLIEKKEREELVKRKFLKELPTLKGQRGKSIGLDDGGWRWVMENLECDLPERELLAGVLRSVLGKLNEFLKVNKLDVQDVIHARQILPSDQAPHAVVSNEKPNSNWPLEKQELLSLAERLGGAETQVRLRDLRKRLHAHARDEVDAVIRELHSDGSLSVIPIDLPTDIDELDIEAAIDIGGRQRHAVIVRRR